MRIISYGGGVQSTAMVIMAATRHAQFEAACGGPVDAAVMSNVGDDSEHPETIDYVKNVIQPWAATLNFPVFVIQKTTKDGSIESLYSKQMGQDKRAIIPVRFENGAPGFRECTGDFKIKVISKWLRNNGMNKDNPAVVAIGISTDEFQRIGKPKPRPNESLVYPLIDLVMSRADCQQVPLAHGLPVPGKSACFFCPFKRPQDWAEMKRDYPHLFDKSVALERRINENRKKQDKDLAWLTRFNKPLDEAIQEAQDQLPGFESIEEAGCDSGHCFT